MTVAFFAAAAGGKTNEFLEFKLGTICLPML